MKSLKWMKYSTLFLFYSVIMLTLGTRVYQPNNVLVDPLPIQPDSPVKNIILFIGDGMGIPQLSAGKFKLVGAHGRLNVERMPSTGLLYTHSKDKLNTDSAAGATALATGFKTRNGMLAMLPDHTRVQTIIQAAQEKALATGIVATASLTHATPAAFMLNYPSRRWDHHIAPHVISSNVQVMLGGGRQYFLPNSLPEGKRTDGRHLVKDAIRKGYTYVDNRTDMAKVKRGKLFGLFQTDGFYNAPEEPSLQEMTEKAIEILSQNENGFILMVEGSQIDWAAHNNDFDHVIREMKTFDDAIGAALDFAIADGNTLVVATADHETGGMGITGGKLSGDDIKVQWITNKHTCHPVPIFAFGPHSDKFVGVNDNTIVPKIMASLLGFPDFPRMLKE